MCAFDPKRTFRLQILTWIKFKVVAHELSSMMDWLSAKPAPVTKGGAPIYCRYCLTP
jgi:hypothetical protein